MIRYAGDVQSANDVCFYGYVALVPVTGDDVVSKASAQPTTGGLRAVSAPLMIAWRHSWIYSSPSTRVNGRWAFALSSFFTAHHKGIGTLLAAPPRAHRLSCYDTTS